MRVLFVTTVDLLNVVGGTLSVAIPMLMAILKKDGHSAETSVYNYRVIKRKIKEFNPDVIAYSVYTGEHKQIIKFNRKLKDNFPGIISIMGGPHATYFPELIYEDGIDAICIGEGFKALPEFLKALENKQLNVPVNNIWRKIDSEVIKGQTGFILDNINPLPAPDYVPYEEYIGSQWPVLSYMTGLGCPYQCSYCFNPVYNKMIKTGFKIRRKTPLKAVEELEFFKKRYGLNYIAFLDDVFTIDAGWLNEFSGIYTRRVSLPFSCITRLELISEEKLEYLKLAGVYAISYGIESGNDYLRNKILNRNQSREMIIEKTALIRAKGIKSYSFNILNIPGETVDNAIETFSLNAECGPTYAEAFQLVPFPGTAVYDYALSSGRYKEGVDSLPVTLKKDVKIENKDRMMISNFQKLFSITVSYPRILPFIKVLIRLPLGVIYEFIRKTYKGYIRQKELTPFKLNFTLRTKLLVNYFLSNKP